jgi:hypothetical protein
MFESLPGWRSFPILALAIAPTVIWSSAIVPASAQVIIIERETRYHSYPRSSCSTIVYGSPIPSPIARDTLTGRPCTGSRVRYSYPVYRSYPRIRRRRSIRVYPRYRNYRRDRGRSYYRHRSPRRRRIRIIYD